MKVYLTKPLKIDSPFFIGLIALFYLFVAYNSVGFHQYDEHFQIVEFANYKMGWINSSKLTWEFHERIRPGLQPFICYILFKICRLFGDSDGFDLTLILRIITATFSIITIRIFIKSWESEITRHLYPFFFLLSYFLWFIPYINVRFSSETWSGLFLLLTLAVIKSDKSNGEVKRFLLIGILLGLSVLLRYQSCIFVAGIIFWLIIVNKAKLTDLFKLCLSTLFVLLIGFIIDRWLYGQYTITIYNYFYANIVKNVASSFGTLPWYWITLYIIKTPGPIGILIFASFFIILIYQPRNILLWAIVPFLIIHSIIPHKELRFIFPLANLCPVIMLLAYQIVKEKFSLHSKVLSFVLLLIFIIFNTAGLIAIAFTGASGQVSVINFIHHRYNNKKINLIINNGTDPYIEGPPLYNTFYDGRAITRQYITTYWNADLFKYKQQGSINLLILAEDDFTGPMNSKLFEKYHLKKVFQNIPDMVSLINRYYNSSLNNDNMLLYEFD